MSKYRYVISQFKALQKMLTAKEITEMIFLLEAELETRSQQQMLEQFESQGEDK